MRIALRLLRRLGARHVVVRRVLWLVGVVRFVQKRRSGKTKVISLRPGETLTMSIDSTNSSHS